MTADTNARPSDRTAAPPAGAAPRVWPTVVAATAVLIVNLDTMLNIALPAISEAFSVEVADITWLVICYVLTYACLLVLTGRLGDAFGHERLLRLGLAGTVVGVAAAGLAPTWGLLLAARVVQGAAAALVLGVAPALVTLSVPAEVRAQALGRFQLGVAMGFAIGPPLGGALVGAFGWRAVYLVRVPLAVLALALVLVRPTGLPRPSGPRPPLDLVGTLSLGAAVASGLLALNRANTSGWTSPLVIGGLVCLPVFAVCWVLAERHSPSPALDPRLFRSGAFAVANLLSAVANGAMFMIWLLAPYYLLTTLGLGPVAGGFALAANPFATAAVAPLAGRLSTRLGAGRLAAIGLGLQAVGLALVGRLGDGSAAVVAALALASVGFGIGLFTVPNLSLVMGAIRDPSRAWPAG
ncbi:MAG: MFS transporter [Acidimicrobiales bacterium]